MLFEVGFTTFLTNFFSVSNTYTGSITRLDWLLFKERVLIEMLNIVLTINICVIYGESLFYSKSDFKVMYT